MYPEYDKLRDACRNLLILGGYPNRTCIEIAQMWDHKIGRSMRKHIAGDLIGHTLSTFKNCTPDELYVLEFAVEHGTEDIKMEIWQQKQWMLNDCKLNGKPGEYNRVCLQ
jgi:hypothetical protein